LILFCFGLHHQITIQLLKCWLAFDWRTTLLTFVQGIGHLSNFTCDRDKSARHIRRAC